MLTLLQRRPSTIFHLPLSISRWTYHSLFPHVLAMSFAEHYVVSSVGAIVGYSPGLTGMMLFVISAGDCTLRCFIPALLVR
jgi:hypothetical protein